MKWIDFNINKPNKDEHKDEFIINNHCTNPKNDITDAVLCALWDDKLQQFGFYVDDTFIIVPEVSHFMRLPEPPKIFSQIKK